MKEKNTKQTNKHQEQFVKSMPRCSEQDNNVQKLKSVDKEKCVNGKTRKRKKLNTELILEFPPRSLLNKIQHWNYVLPNVIKHHCYCQLNKCSSGQKLMQLHRSEVPYSVSAQIRPYRLTNTEVIFLCHPLTLCQHQRGDGICCKNSSLQQKGDNTSQSPRFPQKYHSAPLGSGPGNHLSTYLILNTCAVSINFDKTI